MFNLNKTVTITNTDLPLKTITFVAEEDTASPVGIFLYQKGKPNPYSTSTFHFKTVCSPEDLLLYPFDGVDNSDIFRMCRYNKMIIRSDSTNLINYAYDSVDSRVAHLSNEIDRLKSFVTYYTFSVTYGNFLLKLHIYTTIDTSVGSKLLEKNERAYVYAEALDFPTDKIFLLDSKNFIGVVSPAQVLSNNKEDMSSFFDVVVANAEILDSLLQEVCTQVDNLVYLHNLEHELTT